MSEKNKSTGAADSGSPTAHLPDAAEAEKAIADGIEAAMGIPGSIEEEQMLEAAELLEVIGLSMPAGSGTNLMQPVPTLE